MNKAQRQALKTVGVNLREVVFPRGQLYVVLSPPTTGYRISVLLPEAESGRKGVSRNEVYREGFD
jgi:hypothetical protein